MRQNSRDLIQFTRHLFEGMSLARFFAVLSCQKSGSPVADIRLRLLTNSSYPEMISGDLSHAVKALEDFEKLTIPLVC